MKEERFAMNNVIRLNSPVFPDGISIGVSSDRSIAVVDFLSKKSLNKSDSESETESVFAVALTKKHLQALRKALEDMENGAI